MPKESRMLEKGFMPKEFADSEGYVWNLAFGSNMNSLILQQRRKIYPTESVRVKVQDWNLSFDYQGIPFKEPVFANIQQIDGCELHGVGHKMTLAEFHQLQKSEGGGGESEGYQIVEIKCQTYEGKFIKMWAFKAHPSHEINQKGKGFFPSKRYLDIVKNGAKQIQLDEDYIQYLHKIPQNQVKWPSYIFLFFLALLYFPFYFFLILVVARDNFITRRVNLNKIFWKYIFPPIKNGFWYMALNLPKFIIDNTNHHEHIFQNQMILYNSKDKKKQ